MNKGFTLLEMLVTIVLLTAGIVTLLHMASIGLFADNNTEHRVTALFLAQEKMEEIKGADSYADIDTFAAAQAALTGNYAGFEREVTVSGDPKEVAVTVYWDVKAVEQNLVLTTLFTDYDY